MIGFNALAALSIIPKVGFSFIMPLVVRNNIFIPFRTLVWDGMKSINELTSNNDSNNYVES